MKPRQSLKSLILRTAALGAAVAFMHGGFAAEPRLSPFTTDGCSLFPDRSPDGKTDWCHCCLAHDLAYWRGGTADARLRSDEALKACVLDATRDKALSEAMFAGVRAGGGPHNYTPFRWGYGWPFGRGYAPLTPKESALADTLESAYRVTNPALVCRRP